MTSNFRFPLGRRPEPVEWESSGQEVGLDFLLRFNSQLADGTPDQARFREMISHENVQSRELRRWVEEARAKGDALHRSAYQDLFHAFAKSHGAEVEFGPYESEGESPFHPFQGVWSLDGHTLLVRLHWPSQSLDEAECLSGLKKFAKAYDLPSQSLGLLLISPTLPSGAWMRALQEGPMGENLRVVDHEELLELFGMVEARLLNLKELGQILAPVRFLRALDVLSFLQEFLTGAAPEETLRPAGFSDSPSPIVPPPSPPSRPPQEPPRPDSAAGLGLEEDPWAGIEETPAVPEPPPPPPPPSMSLLENIDAPVDPNSLSAVFEHEIREEESDSFHDLLGDTSVLAPPEGDVLEMVTQIREPGQGLELAPVPEQKPQPPAMAPPPVPPPAPPPTPAPSSPPRDLGLDSSGFELASEETSEAPEDPSPPSPPSFDLESEEEEEADLLQGLGEDPFSEDSFEAQEETISIDASGESSFGYEAEAADPLDTLQETLPRASAPPLAPPPAVPPPAATRVPPPSVPPVPSQVPDEPDTDWSSAPSEPSRPDEIFSQETWAESERASTPPPAPGPEDDPDQLLALGRNYFEQGMFEKAVTPIKTLIREQTDHVEANLLLGQVHYAMSEFPKAALSFEVVLNKDRTNIQARVCLGDVYFSQAKYNRALKTYQKAAEDGAERDPEVQLRLARTYQAVHQPSEALRALEAAVELDSANPDVYLELGNHYLDSKQPGPALTVFQKGLEIDPGNLKLRTYVENLS